jgi:hypothetical protein
MRAITLFKIITLFPGLIFANAFILSPVKQKNVVCDYLIITVDSLKAAAQELAGYRAVNQNDEVTSPKIITMEDIEKEFAESNVPRDKIVWNALHYIYVNWQKPFKYLVLAGDDSLQFNTTSLFSIGEQLSVTKRGGWETALPNFILLGDPAIPLMQPANKVLLSVDNGIKTKITATIAGDATGKWKYTAEIAIPDSVQVSAKQGGWWFVKRRALSEISDSGKTSLTIELPDSLKGKRVQISFYVTSDLKCARNDTIIIPGTTGIVSPVNKNGLSLPAIALSEKTLRISVGGANEYLSKVVFFSLRGQKMVEMNLGNKTAWVIPIKNLAISTGFYIVRVSTNKSILSRTLLLQK